MRVRQTQIIDYWIGVPLCFLLSIWHSLVSLTRYARRRSSARETILFIELSEMGSTVLAHSAIEQCRIENPGSRLCFLIFERNRESVELLGTIAQEDIITISDRTLLHFLMDSLRFFNWAWRARLDTVIDLELFSRATMILSYLSGAPERIGFFKGTSEGLYRGNLLTVRVAYNFHQHMPLNFLALVRSLSGADRQDEYIKENLAPLLKPLPRFVPNMKEQEKVWTALRELRPDLLPEHRLVLVNPDPGDALPVRGWPLEHYRNTMRSLIGSEEKIVFVVMGLARSAEFARDLREHFSEKEMIDFTGKTANLREMLTLFTFARVLLTGDSGPAHFASLTTIRTVVLFGPETPVLYRPLGDRAVTVTAELACSPCLSAFNHRYTRCTDNRCMQRIESRFVTSLVQQELRKTTPSESGSKGP